ncbi:serine/threonine-protein kinase [Geodermatophilus sp. URMC 62]|uniref:serine/threonine-protein kinase n=1 Tax=Geodermatophilus sp. URMC 62 TaxID=3423414 RepID=UPI00406C74E9
MSTSPGLRVPDGTDGDRVVVAGRYRLDERLGVGGMSTVWRAEDLLLGRVVAVKELTFPVGASAADRAVMQERMRREGRAAAGLDHPDVVTVHDVVEEGATTFLVMQYVPARTLTEVVEQDGPLSRQATARVGLAVLGALRAVHARGVVHRDVKPSNVLVSSQDPADPVGRVLLTDFGIASVPGDQSLTSTGLLIGSPGYMAPEHARGDEPGPAADLWALGATLFTAVEGRPPYEGRDPMTTLALVMVGEHAPYLRAGLLAPVLEGLLQRDPAARTTADEAARALARVARTPSRAEVPPATVPPAAVAPDAPARTALLQLPGDGDDDDGDSDGDGDGDEDGDGDGSGRPPRTGTTPVPGAAPDRFRVVVGPRRRPRRRARRLLAAGLLVAALIGVVLAVVLVHAGGSDAPPPARSATSATSALPPLPADAATPDEQLSATVAALREATADDPAVVGAAGGEVLARLEEVARQQGPARRSAALLTAGAVATAVSEGTLARDVGERVGQVLDGVVRPDRLVDLVELVAHDPTAIGPAGPALLEELVALDHQVPADRTAEVAAALATTVTRAAEDDQVSPAFRDAALPTLRGLAEPGAYAALQALLADTERDPARVGPAAGEVLDSLRAAATLPVFEQGTEVGELLGLLRDQSRVTPAFRDQAVPVLTPLVR